MDAERLERARLAIGAFLNTPDKALFDALIEAQDAMAAALNAAPEPAQVGDAPASPPSAFCTRFMVPVDDPSHPNPEDWRSGCPGPHTPRKPRPPITGGHKDTDVPPGLPVAPAPAQAWEAVAWEATGRYGGAPATKYGDSRENAFWLYMKSYGASPDAIRPLVYAAPSRPGGAA